MNSTNSPIVTREAQKETNQNKVESFFFLVSIFTIGFLTSIAIISYSGESLLWLSVCVSFPFLSSFVAWRKSFSFKIIPLPILTPTILVAVGVMGYIQNSQAKTTNIENQVFQFKIPQDIALNTIKVYYLAAIFLLLSALVVFDLQYFKYGFVNIKQKIDSKAKKKENSWLYLLIGVASTIFYVQQIGLHNLIFRDTYIAANDNIQSNSYINIIFMVQIALIGIVAWKFQDSSRLIRNSFRIMLFIFMVEAFAKGSRVGAIYLLSWASLTYLRHSSRSRLFLLITSLPFAVLFSNLMVWFRHQPFHGLFGQFGYMKYFPWHSASEWFTTNVGSYSFNISGYAGFMIPKLPHAFFWTSINPLPGFMTNWYSIAASLRFNYYAPYTSIGELYNYGLLFFVIYFCVLGGLCGYACYALLCSSARGRTIMPASMFGITILALAMSLQYNLRSTSRFILLSFLLSMMFKIRHNRSTKNAKDIIYN